MFKKEEYDNLHVYNFMKSSPEYVYINEKMDSVMNKFEKTGAWNLPVVDEFRTYLGFVSKSKLLSVYRRMMINYNSIFVVNKITSILSK